MSSRPPWLAERLLALLLPEPVRESILADLDDAFAHPARRRRRLWYWWQAIRTLSPSTLFALHRGERRVFQLAAPSRARLLAASLGADFRLASRRIAKHPSVAFTVAFLLTTGVASAGVVYSIFSELLRPRVGVPAADAIYAITITDSAGNQRRTVSRQWLSELVRLPGGAQLVYSTTRDGVVRSGSVPVNTRVGFVSPLYFRHVGVRPALGRRPSTSVGRREALVSYRLWSTQLAGDPSVVGRELMVNRAPYMVSGVAPSSFDGLEGGAGVWIPLDDETAAAARISSVQLYARVDDPKDVARLTAPIVARVTSWLQTGSSTQARSTIRFASVRDSFSMPSEGTALRSASMILGVLCVLVLVAACANTANLLGMEILERSHEIAVRSALGAGRLRLARQLLVEYGVHAALGIGLSIVTTIGVIKSMPRWLPLDETSADRFALRPAGLAVVCLCAIVTMALAIALPLGRAAKAAHRLRSVGVARRASGRSVSALVALQIGQAVVLVATALTLARSESFVRRQPIGFDGRSTHVLIYSLPRSLYDTVATRRFHAGVLQSLREASGVKAALAAPTPLVGFETTAIAQPGSPSGIAVRRTAVSGGYLEAIGARLIEGRSLADTEPAPTIVISRDVARAITPNGSAIGRSLRLDADSATYTVVGVIEAGTYGGVEPVPTVLTPLSARTTYAPTIVVRSARPRREIERVTRETVARLDADVPVTTLGSLMTLLDRVRFLTVVMRGLALAFCVVALVVSALGLYAHLARYVSARSAELGLRMALGATPARLSADLLGQSARLAGVGLAGGLIGALWVRSVLTNWLMGVPGDWVVLALVIVTTALLVVVATLIPGWRVSRVDAARVLSDSNA
jgi:predicted permease